MPGDVVTNAVIDDLARIIPLDDEALWQSADAAAIGYQRRRLTVEDAKGDASKLPDTALCTDLGIAVSDAASPGISEAIATAATAKRLSGDPQSLLDRALDRASDLWSLSVSQAAGLIGQARRKAGQAAQGIAQEIAPRWFAHP